MSSGAATAEQQIGIDYLKGERRLRGKSYSFSITLEREASLIEIEDWQRPYALLIEHVLVETPATRMRYS